MSLAEQMAQQHVRILTAAPPIKSFNFAIGGKGQTEQVAGFLAYEKSPFIQDLQKKDPQKLAAMTVWEGPLKAVTARTDIKNSPNAAFHAPACR